MGDSAVLFVKPGTVKVSDKTHLRKAGIIVVEVADPQDVKFIRAEGALGAQELPHGDLLAAAAKAIRGEANGYVKAAFANAVSDALVTRHARGAK